MIPELGHFALIMALCMAAVQALVPLFGAALSKQRWMDVARPAARAQFALVALAFVCLAGSFLGNDFSVLNVASNSNSSLPWAYRLAATWGSHEGSLLLWLLMLAGWTLAVSLGTGQLPQAMAARILGVLGLLSVGFLLFILLTSNPFERMLPGAVDGQDLNPLLQDPGMVVHPPVLYMGYVGLSVPFAFAIAALIGGQLDAAWARWSRPWTILAWMFLTLGIAMGSIWAYYELGWGGWWFWDPVENASFMPWLLGTALMHALSVTERTGGFRAWTVLLAILAFSMSLLGTFLVRSGVLTSVHAFATDPARGVFILAFLVVVIGGSLLLFAWRAPRVGLGGSFDLVSRESAMLAGNLLLLVAAGAVLLGTLYPLLLDALGMGKISVGPPYFETVFAPLMAPALFLMGIGPLAKWKRAELPALARRLRWAFGVAMASALLLPLALGRWSAGVAFGLFLSLWIVSATVVNFRERLRLLPGSKTPWTGRLTGLQRAYWGMLVAHLGVACFVAGVTLVKGYASERDLPMRPGDTTELAGFVFRLDGFGRLRGPNYEAVQAHMTVLKGDAVVASLRPQKRIYDVQRTPMTEAAIEPRLSGDLYVSLGEPLDDGAWIVRLYSKPFVDWIWAGAGLMALGGLLAVTDRRYRHARRAAKAAVPMAGAASP